MLQKNFQELDLGFTYYIYSITYTKICVYENFGLYLYYEISKGGTCYEEDFVSGSIGSVYGSV